MKLYLITQDLVDGYDTYDSAVVAASSEQAARETHPCQLVTHHKDGKWMGTFAEKAGGGEYDMDYRSDWVSFENIDKVGVEYLGETDHKAGVICASFNAG